MQQSKAESKTTPGAISVLDISPLVRRMEDSGRTCVMVPLEYTGMLGCGCCLKGEASGDFLEVRNGFVHHREYVRAPTNTGEWPWHKQVKVGCGRSVGVESIASRKVPQSKTKGARSTMPQPSKRTGEVIAPRDYHFARAGSATCSAFRS